MLGVTTENFKPLGQRQYMGKFTTENMATHLTSNHNTAVSEPLTCQVTSLTLW
jgi:hypothetical protein